MIDSQVTPQHPAAGPVATARRAPSRRSPQDWLRIILLPILGLALFIGTWWGAVIVFQVPEYEIPSPGAIAVAFAQQPGDISAGVWTTLQEMLYGFGLAIVVGLILALLVSASRTLNEMFYPLIVAANAVPKVALAPALAVAFGLGIPSKVVVVFLVCFFPIVVSSYAGFISTPPDLNELARALSASRLQTFAKVRFPSALPQIFVGVKVAAGLAAVGAVVGEFGGSMRGLGNEMGTYSGQGRAPEGFAAVALLSILSVALFYLVVGLERLVVPWDRRMRAVAGTL
jgi:NitT/TauT family transport system permease protein